MAARTQKAQAAAAFAETDFIQPCGKTRLVGKPNVAQEMVCPPAAAECAQYDDFADLFGCEILQNADERVFQIGVVFIGWQMNDMTAWFGRFAAVKIANRIIGRVAVRN